MEVTAVILFTMTLLALAEVSQTDHGILYEGTINRDVEGSLTHSVDVVRHKRQAADMSNAAGYVSTVGSYMNTVGSVVGPVTTVVNIATQVMGLMQQSKDLKAKQKLFEMNMRLNTEQLCDQLCVTNWGLWSICTARCGGGVAYRTREHILPGRCKSLSGFKCRHGTNQTAICNPWCANHARPKEGGGGCDCRRGFTGLCCDDEVICEHPGKPANGVLEVPVPAKYGNVAIFYCNEGFALIGEETLLCGENGKWSGSRPKCEKIYCDGNIPDPTNGIIINKEPRYRYGDYLAFMCNEGYVMRGPDVRRCVNEGEGGRWAAFNPICLPLDCDEPGYPLHGERNGTDFSLDGVVTFTCNHGYRLIGSEERHCLQTGRWSGNEPTCQLVTCYAPIVPRFSRLLRHRTKYPLGVTVGFECDDGFVLNGSATARCIRDYSRGLFGPGGRWSVPPPVCQAALCGDPGHPENGIQDGNIYYYPYNVSFTCFAGHVMRGLSEIMCLIDGSWSGDVPYCESCVLNFYKDSADDYEECVPCPDNTHTVTTASTSKQQCVCNHKYRGPPGGPCEEITCSVLEGPSHGSISPCGNKMEDTCSFDCNDGYFLSEGSGVRSCQESGNWTGIQPVCAACPKDTFKGGPSGCLPCPQHSHTATSGSMVSACVCDNGYKGPAAGPCTDKNECLTNSGKGPCEDLCENLEGTYRCACSIPGYKIDPKDRHACIVGKTCRNLTVDDAPGNGGLVCHWFHVQNSQQCTVKCNDGYEFPSRFNNYEHCGSSTGYRWSHEERGAIFEPCIVEFFPGFRLEADAAYFVQSCADLTEAEKLEVKKEFANRLNNEKLCKRKETKMCDIKDIGIICGRTTRRRRKRGIEEEEESVDFQFDIKVVKMEENPKNCDRICIMLRIPDRDCSSQCFSAYKRFLIATAMYSKRKLKQIYSNKNLWFRAANRTFEPSGDEPHISDVIVECDSGMEGQNNTCIPCPAGYRLSGDRGECLPCPRGTFQPEDKQYVCLTCPPGTYSPSPGAKICSVCPAGWYGPLCRMRCDCAHGRCDARSGRCVCHSGWEGTHCDTDIQSCKEDSCYPGVHCDDIPAPGLGFKCGPCPQGMMGNGVMCT